MVTASGTTWTQSKAQSFFRSISSNAANAQCSSKVDSSFDESLLSCVKEEYQSNSWKCLNNDTAATIFRRRSVEFIATASLATKYPARQEQKLSRESESRRQLYMFRKAR